MKTYEIVIQGQSVYVKTDAEPNTVQQAINFVPKGEKYVERLLQAIRISGAKATELKIEPVEIFEVE